MLLNGILLALAAGMFWNISGIVNSLCAKKKYDLYSYLLTNTIFTALFTGIISGGVGGVFHRGMLLFAAVIILAGLINTSGLLLLQKALQHGHHGIVFLISQAAPAIPFIAGMLFLGDKPSFLKVGGVILIFTGMFSAALPKLRERHKPEGEKNRKWLIPALCSFGLFGIAHTMMALPSLMDLPSKAAQYRPFLFYCGCSTLMITASALRSCTSSKISFNRLLLLIGAAAALLNVCSMKIFFNALDNLAAAHAVGLGSPLATSASLAGFTLYSWFYLSEKREPAAVFGFFCICTGAVAASL